MLLKRKSPYLLLNTKKAKWNLLKNINTRLRMIGRELYNLIRLKLTYLALIVLDRARKKVIIIWILEL